MYLVVLLRGMAATVWLVIFIGIILTLRRAAKGQSIKAVGCILVGLFVVAGFANLLGTGLVFIQPTDRGVVISQLDEGIRPEALTPGLHFTIPLLENVIHVPISQQTYTMSIEPDVSEIQGDDSNQATTTDDVIVALEASVIFSIDPDKTVDVYIKWQKTYLDNLVIPQARGVIRNSVSRFTLEEICTNYRQPLTELIFRDLSDMLGEGGLILHGFIVRRIAPCDV